MAPWKIDFLGTPPPDDRTSGPDRAQWELAGALVHRGHRVRVLYTTDRPEIPPPYKGVEGVPVPLPASGRRAVQLAGDGGRAASDCLSPDTDLVVVQDARAGALRLPSRGGRAIPVIAYYRAVELERFDAGRGAPTAGGFRGRVGGWLDRRTLRKLEATALSHSQLVFVTSSAVRDRVQQLYRVPLERLVVLPPGVPGPDPTVERSEARLALRIPPDVPAILFVGRDPERQGLPVALEAFRRIRGFFPGARFLVVGASPKAEPGVIPLGVVDELTKTRAFRAADLFLFPGQSDGFGLAVREAMRYGLPVVASPHVPMDGADPKHDFRLVTSEDAADYAADVAELLADPALRRRMGEAGRAYADRFGVDKVAEMFETQVARRLPASP
jgi:glycosyltransferase involved in cell wall biosynthesis